jgi:HK97 family phage major capsid protein
MDKLKLLLEALKNAKKVAAAGFTSIDETKAYLQEREALVEQAAYALEDIGEAHDADIKALKTQINSLREELKAPAQIRERTSDEVLASVGKMVGAIFRKDTQTLGRLDMARPNPVKGADDQEWAAQRDLMFDKAQDKFISRAPVGNPFGGNDDGQYVINPIFERDLLRYAVRSSVMMGKIRTVPMFANEHSWPTLKRHRGNLRWHGNIQGPTASGSPSLTGGPYQEAGKPQFGERVVLTCKTLAGWIPWYDMFSDDIQVNIEIGALFLEFFAELYGMEFDYQVLFAQANPFTGIFKEPGAREYTISGATPMSTVLDDLTQAPLTIPKQDRENGIWIVSEDFVSWLAANRNAIGDYAWIPPMEGQRPGRIAGKEYIEFPSDYLSIHEVDAGQPFAWFGNPRNIWHGNRMGTELRTFRETESGLLYGEEFIRFRKRDAFKVVQTENSVLLKTAPRG